MKLTAQAVTDHIYTELIERVTKLAKHNIEPHLVVFLVGDDPGSIAYINQKQKKAEYIGAKVTVLKYPTTLSNDELVEKIELLNNDPYVHGILVQRPLPKHIDTELVELKTTPEKDIDGFNPDSPYTLPLPLAIFKILEHIYKTQAGVASVGDPHRAPAANARTSDGGNTRQNPVGFKPWLQSQSIAIMGKGETGGQPIINYFHKHGLKPQVIDSKTSESEAILKQADIVISAVGKPDVIKANDLKTGTILLGVGMRKGGGKKLHGDFNEQAVEDIVSVYTPTPRGVGPVNVAMLMENLVTATEKQTATI